MHIPRGGNVWCFVAPIIGTDRARVCCVTLLFSGPGSLNRLIKRSLREVWCVRLREEREELRNLVSVIYRLPGMSQCFFLSDLIPACMPTYCPTTQHASHCWPRPINLAACVDRVSQASHSWAPNQLSE